jgi:uncharacterized membrane protein YphA (DoxX/SURF4 family)
MTFRRLVRAWDAFLFAPVSPLPLAVYRVLLGALVIVSGLLLLPDAEALFGERGILPRADALQYDRLTRLSLLTWLPATPFWLYAFFGAHLLAAACLTFGFMTRLAAVLVWAGLVSIHYRNPAITHSGDAVLRVAAFFLMFAPAGRALSADRWLRVRRGAEPPGPPAPIAPWAQRLIQIQLCVVYLSTVWWKLGGFAWIDGTAVYYASRLVEFERFPVPFVFEFRPVLKLLTWGTLAVEVALGTLVWFRDLRYPVLLAGLLLHLGLEYSMNIPLFQWAMLSAYVLFVDPRDVRRAADRVRRRRGVKPAPLPTGAAPQGSPTAGAATGTRRS